MKERGLKPGNITYLFSPKNGKDLVHPNDLCLCLGLHLEADEDVRSFETDSDRIREKLKEVGYNGEQPQAWVRYFSGRAELIFLKRSERSSEAVDQSRLKILTEESAKVNLDCSMYSAQMAVAEERCLHDWLRIVTVLSQANDSSKNWIDKHLSSTLAARGTLSMLQLSQSNLGSWEEVFCAVFRLVQSGCARTDLETRPLGWETQVSHRGA